MLKAPPNFDLERDNYEQFKKDISLWELLTELDNKKKGPAVYLSLKNKAREAVRNLPIEEISAEGGLKTIIDRLDEVYLADRNTRAYEAFQRFYKCKRDSGETFEQFIVRFERMYGDLENYDMKLPEGIRAFFVLNAANLTGEMEKLARATTTDLTYKGMKEQIKKICGTVHVSGNDESDVAPPVKDEILLGYAGGRTNRNWSNRGRGGRGGRGQGGSRPVWIDQRSGQSQENWRSDAEPSSRKRSDEAGNVRDKHGNQMRCFGCESTQHFIKDCPRNLKKSQEVNLILLNLKPDKKQKTLVIEALGKGVLDCGCTRTVAGEFWMSEFISTLSADDTKLVREESSNAIYRFGDGGECKSFKRVIIPIKIGSRDYLLRVEVVANEIPLLLSKGTMKSLGVTESNLDLKNDLWILDGEEVRLHCTTSGHYCVPISSFQVDSENITLTVLELEKLGKKEKRAKAIKLHRQFGHASDEKLLKLIKESNIDDKQLNACVREVCASCEICQKYKPAPLKPAVSLPLATRFNHVVCLDLKEHVQGKQWILHMIDAATRYSAARWIKSKRKEIIAAKLFEMWISYFGKPKTLMSDNGGEFDNSLYKEVSQILGIEVIMPPGESPFSNGIVERHNKVLYETMMKTRQDADCDDDVALAWACSAKNALQNHGGYSPNQLVFGYNVNIPTVLTDKLPALSSTTSSEIIRTNLEALHAARKNYIEAENSTKIRKALKHKTRVYTEQNFQQGDKVFFKRKSHRGWKGPGSVMGTDGYTVLVKLGGSFYKCHRCHVMKAHAPQNDHIAEADNRASISAAAIPLQQQSTAYIVEDSSSDSSDSSLMVNEIVREEHEHEHALDQVHDEQEHDENVQGDNGEQEHDEQEHNIDDVLDSGEPIIDAMEQEMLTLLGTDASLLNLEAGVATASVSESVSDENTPTNDAAIVEDSAVNDNINEISELSGQIEMEKETCERPKQRSYVNIKMENEVFDALIMSYQPKKTSTYKDWINIQILGECDPRSINWTDVEEWHLTESPEIPIFLTKYQESDQSVVDAKFKELDNLKKNDVFDEVSYSGQSTISCRWVFTEKNESDGTKRVKARLVARGFEENSKNLGVRTDSPTCNRHSLKMVMLTASAKNWKICSIDVASAFLQGNQIEREVYIRPPVELCDEDKVWRLKRCLYGLNDAPREWYNKIYEEFIQSGAVRSTLDNAMFMWYDENDVLIGHLVSHVDDFNYTGTDEWQRVVMNAIKGKFNISAESESNFIYLGLNVCQAAGKITIDQRHYIDKLEEIPLSAERRKLPDEPATKEEKTDLRSLSGQMLWVTSQTRPDATFGTCMMSNPGKNPSVKQIMEANKTVRKLKNYNKVVIQFRDIGSFEDLDIVVHGDASHASLPDGSSQGAFIVFIRGADKHAIPVLWRSKKLKRVTKSPLASEILAVGEASDGGIFIANVVKELYKLKKMPKVTCITDSKSLKDNLNTSNTVDDMSVRVEMARLREMVNRNEIKYVWVQSKENLADVMTKKTASSDALLDVLMSGQHM